MRKYAPKPRLFNTLRLFVFCRYLRNHLRLYFVKRHDDFWFSVPTGWPAPRFTNNVSYLLWPGTVVMYTVLSPPLLRSNATRARRDDAKRKKSWCGLFPVWFQINDHVKPQRARFFVSSSHALGTLVLCSQMQRWLCTIINFQIQHLHTTVESRSVSLS